MNWCWRIVVVLAFAHLACGKNILSKIVGKGGGGKHGRKGGRGTGGRVGKGSRRIAAVAAHLAWLKRKKRELDSALSNVTRCPAWKDDNLVSGACICDETSRWGTCQAARGLWAGVRAGTCSDSESSDVGNGIDEACAEGELQSARAHAVQQQLACSCRTHTAEPTPPPSCRLVAAECDTPLPWVQQPTEPQCARRVCSTQMLPEAARLASSSAFLGSITCTSSRHPGCACLFPGLRVAQLDGLLRGTRVIGDSTSLQFAAALRSVLNAPPGALERLIASQETALCAQRARGAGGGQGAQQFGGGEANQTRATGSAATYNVARPLCRLPNPELEEIVKADMRQDHPRSALPRSYPWNSLNPQDPTLVRRAAGEHVAVFNYGLHMLAGFVDPKRWATNVRKPLCSPEVCDNPRFPRAVCQNGQCAGCAARTSCTGGGRMPLGTFPLVPGETTPLSVAGNFSSKYPAFLESVARRLRAAGFSHVVFRSSNAIHDAAFVDDFETAVRACRDRESSACDKLRDRCVLAIGPAFVDACRDLGLDGSGSAHLNCLALCRFSTGCGLTDQTLPVRTRVCAGAPIDGYLDMGMVSAMHPECTRRGDGRHVFALELVGVRLLADVLLTLAPPPSPPRPPPPASPPSAFDSTSPASPTPAPSHCSVLAPANFRLPRGNSWPAGANSSRADIADRASLSGGRLFCSMTAVPKRLNLYLERILESFDRFEGATLADSRVTAGFVIVLDGATQLPQRARRLAARFPWAELVAKEYKWLFGQAHALNYILCRLRASAAAYWLRWEDSWLVSAPFISRALALLQTSGIFDVAVTDTHLRHVSSAS